MRPASVYLLLSALVFVLIGLNTLHDPVAAMMGVGLAPASINAWNEVRANYGGLQIAIGLLLDGMPGALMQGLLALESSAALIGLLLLRAGRQ